MVRSERTAKYIFVHVQICGDGPAAMIELKDSGPAG